MKLKSIATVGLLPFFILTACKSNNKESENNKTIIEEAMNNKINSTPQEEAGVRKALDAYIEVPLHLFGYLG